MSGRIIASAFSTQCLTRSFLYELQKEAVVHCVVAALSSLSVFQVQEFFPKVDQDAFCVLFITQDCFKSFAQMYFGKWR